MIIRLILSSKLELRIVISSGSSFAHKDTRLFQGINPLHAVAWEDVVAYWDHRESGVVEERVLLPGRQGVL
jgi:hypothetical protein